MNKFTNVLEAYMLPFAGKLSQQRHLNAIKNGFIAAMPLGLTGSIVVMLSNVFTGSETLIGEILNRMLFYRNFVQPFLDEHVNPVLNQMWWGMMALGVVFSIFTISYSLAKEYNEDGLAAGVTALAAYLVTLPQQAPDAGWGTIHWSSFAAQALFAGLIIAIFSTEIFCFAKRKNWTIKMPAQVPPAVSRAFSATIPTALSVAIWATIGVFFLNTLDTTIQDFINNLIQAPLMNLGQSPVSLVILLLLQQLLWFFGLHGALIIGPVLDLMYSPALGLNAQNVLVYGIEPTHVITRNFADVYGMHGGSGATLGLILAILIFSKRKEYKTLSKMGVAPGIFQINEPMIFGMPLVLNPIMAIPFIFTPALMALIGWFFTAIIPFAGIFYIAPPWTTPPIVSAFLASGGDIGATIVATGTLALSVVIYIPFVLMANKEVEAQEKESVLMSNADGVVTQSLVASATVAVDESSAYAENTVGE